MAGSLAAVTFLPTSIPLIWQIIRAEETLGIRHTQASAFSVHSAIRNGVPPSAELAHENAVQHLSIRQDGNSTTFGEPLAEALIQQACGVERQAVVGQRDGTRTQWAVACVDRNGLRVVAAIPTDPQSHSTRVFILVLLLAMLVGMITALGILRLLRPLSEVSASLARVGAGERGVRMQQTGLAELDELVDRLNAAARSVEDREDAITGRIQVVQEMARIVAHEIRNPLQSLELLTTLIAQEEDDGERHEIAESIHAEIRTLEQVVTRLLRESAMRGSLRLRVDMVPVAPLVEQVIALRRPQANRSGVRLQMGPVSQTAVPMDATLIKRCIENLMLNALQAVPDRFGEVRVSVLDEVNWMVVLVDDNGPGVDPKVGDAIFEPKVTSKAGGTGLGLALVKGVVEAHNGYIRYGPSPLGGARFEARIPLRQEAQVDNDDEPLDDLGGG